MSERLRCAVPFCRRTCKAAEMPLGWEWVCGDHWRRVSPLLRRRKNRLGRVYRKRFGDVGFWTFPAGSPKRLQAVKLDRLCRRAWEACKRQAIERAAGI